jgi:hypothetical protein
MNFNKACLLICFVANTFFSSAQNKITTTSKASPAQDLNAFFNKISNLCSHPNDNELKQLLTDNLKNNKAFLKDWEIGLNNTDAQIWQALSRLIKLPYTVDSSNKTKITCTVPNIKDANKTPNSLGKLVILSQDNLSDDKDIIYSQPNEKGKPIGKVKPGEQYRYFVGTAAYSASMKQYITDGFDYSGEGDIGYFAIELDANKHKLGYISTNATSASLPVMHLQYMQGAWKITKLEAN